MKIKVRVAPSPTGFLHVGTAQSALYNWLFARKNGGEFYIRIEDTDKARSTKEFEDNIIDGLKWLGIDWDGSVSHSTDNYPRYQELLEQLLKEGKAFYCYHTQEELEVERKQQEANKEAPRHVCKFKVKSEKLKMEDGKGVIRLRVDEGSDRVVAFEDSIRRRIEFKQALLGDFSIARAIDDPLYHFAVVVDDIDMNITHVLRGEDHISNTPKQILIYEALDKPVPQFAHLPLLLASDRSKLSKRHGAVSIADYKKDYLPEAIVNFLGVLGYTFSKEIMSKEEMVEEFELSNVHKSGAVFDIKKLNWVNSQWIKKMSSEEFRKLVNKPGLSDSIVKIITERLEKLSDIDNFSYLWQEPKYEKDLLVWKMNSPFSTISSLMATAEIIGRIGVDDVVRLREEENKLAEKQFQGDRGSVYWPLRVSATGKEKSPDPIEIVHELGKKETLERIGRAIEKLEAKDESKK